MSEKVINMLDGYASFCSEKKVIGCLMSTPNLLDRHNIKVSDFYFPNTRALFNCIVNMYEAGYKAITGKDVVEYADKEMIDFYTEEGLNFLIEKADNFPVHYNRLKLYTTLRKLKKAGVDVSDLYDPYGEEAREQLKRLYKMKPTEIVEHYTDKLDIIKNSCSTNEERNIFTPIDPDDLEEDDSVDFLIDNFMNINSFNSIVATSKAGKTQFAYQMAFCVENGIDFLGHKVKQSDVVYVDFELPKGMIKEKVRKLKAFYNLPNAKNFKVIPLNGVKDQPEALDKVVEAIELEKKNNPNLRLCIFDCFYRFHKGDGNSEEDVSRTLSKIKVLTENLAVTYIHHTNKTGITKNGEALVAAGGSGVHGKIVDTTYVLNNKRNETMLVSTGRYWTNKEYTLTASNLTNYYFTVKNNPVAIPIEDDIEEIEDEELEAEEIDNITQTIIDYVIKKGEYSKSNKTYSMTLYNLQKVFPEEKVSSLKERGIDTIRSRKNGSYTVSVSKLNN